MLQFGIGGLYARPVGGNLATGSGVPQQFGTLQDVSIDIDQKLVELRGQKKFPDDIAPSDLSIKGKASFAKIQIDMYNALFFGETITAGIKKVIEDETQTPSSNAFTVAGNGNFVSDLGLRYADGSGTLKQVTAGSEAAGKYSVVESGANKGKYTFASADNNKAMLVTYAQNDSGNGNTLPVTNRIQGYGPVFELWATQPYQGANGMHLFACRSSKMNAPMKRDGYLVSDFEFMGFANGAGNVFEWFQVSP